MPTLPQIAGTKNQLIHYDFGQKTCEEPVFGVRIHMFKLGLPFLPRDIMWTKNSLAKDQTFSSFKESLEICVQTIPTGHLCRCQSSNWTETDCHANHSCQKFGVSWVVGFENLKYIVSLLYYSVFRQMSLGQILPRRMSLWELQWNNWPISLSLHLYRASANSVCIVERS